MGEEALILGRYRPLAELGAGGAGSVVLAFDTRMHRRVAIKRLTAASVTGFGSDGLAEARTAALLTHPSIVTIHEYDVEPETDDALLIMEAVDGATLAEVLDAHGALDDDEAAAVLLPVAAALRYAHDNGVLHLDIKPGNVLITLDGDVKVADFGIARLTGVDGTAAPIGGTLGSMPPEQLDGDPLDERTDEWALAALAYEVLTGTNPLVAPDVESARILAARPLPRASTLEPSLDPLVDQVLARALAYDPDERFPSVAAFSRALAPALGDSGAGADKLAYDVRALADDEIDDDEREGVWDLLGSGSAWLLRAAAAVAGFAITWAGLSATQLDIPALAVGAGLVGVAGAIVPALGLALGLVALAAGAWTQGIVPFIAAVALGAAFWLLWLRQGGWAAVAPLYAPLFALLRIAPALPLGLGFFLRPLMAAGAAGLAAALTMTASAASGYGAPLLEVDPLVVVRPWITIQRNLVDMTVLLTPGPWLTGLGWAAAAALTSAIARRGGRAMGLTGVAAGAMVLALAYLGWSRIAGFPLAGPAALQLAIGTGLALVIAAIGPPPDLDADDE